MRFLSIACLAALVTFSAARAQDPGDVLDEAKTFYREGRFGRTIARLQTLVVELRAAEGADVEVEAEAQLYLALAYVALDDPESAKASFVRLLELTPERRLDPDVYAPKVVSLFEDARREAPRRVTSPVSATTTSSAPPDGDDVSRLPGTLLGAAAGAGGAVLVQQLSGESTTTVTTPQVTTSTAPVGLEVDARMNGLKQGTFACGQGLVLSVDVINHGESLEHVEGLDVSFNTMSPECVTHRPALDGNVGMDVLPGARIRIRDVDLAGDLCRSPGRVPGCRWQAVVVIVTARGSFEDRLDFETVP